MNKNYIWNDEKSEQRKVPKKHNPLGKSAFVFLILTIVFSYLSFIITVVKPDMFNLFPVCALLCGIAAISCFVKSGKNAKSEPKNNNSFHDLNSGVKPHGETHNQSELYEIQHLKREFQIIRESVDIAEKTQNLETFCTRYNLCMNKARKLYTECTNGTINIDLYDPREACMAIIRFADSMKSLKLEQFKDQIAAAEELTTKSGKLNRYKSLSASLAQAKDVFDGMPEYDSLVSIVNMHISVLECTEFQISVQSGNCNIGKEVHNNTDNDDYLNMSQQEATNEILKKYSFDDVPVEDMDDISRQRSEALAQERERRIARFDPYSVKVVVNKNEPLNSIEKNFMKQMAGEPIKNPHVNAYWTYEYSLNFEKTMTKLISNGYLEIGGLQTCLETLTVLQLKDILSRFNLLKTGKKADLIERINNEVSHYDLEECLKKTPRIYVLTEKGSNALNNLPNSATKDTEFEDECLRLLAAGDVNGAYKLVCKNENEKIIPRGLGVNWQDQENCGLSDKRIALLTEFLDSDVSAILPAEYYDYAFLFKCCCVLGVMLGIQASETVKTFIRVTPDNIIKKPQLIAAMQDCQFKIM